MQQGSWATQSGEWSPSPTRQPETSEVQTVVAWEERWGRSKIFSTELSLREKQRTETVRGGDPKGLERPRQRRGTWAERRRKTLSLPGRGCAVPCHGVTPSSSAPARPPGSRHFYSQLFGVIWSPSISTFSLHFISLGVYFPNCYSVGCHSVGKHFLPPGIIMKLK